MGMLFMRKGEKMDNREIQKITEKEFLFKDLKGEPVPFGKLVLELKGVQYFTDEVQKSPYKEKIPSLCLATDFITIKLEDLKNPSMVYSIVEQMSKKLLDTLRERIDSEEKEGIIKKRVRIKSWSELVEEGYEVFCPSEVSVPCIRFPKSGHLFQMTDLILGRQGEVLISKNSNESLRLVIVENVLRAYCCEEMLVYLN